MILDIGRRTGPKNKKYSPLTASAAIEATLKYVSCTNPPISGGMVPVQMGNDCGEGGGYVRERSTFNGGFGALMA